MGINSKDLRKGIKRLGERPGFAPRPVVMLETGAPEDVEALVKQAQSSLDEAVRLANASAKKLGIIEASEDERFLAENSRKQAEDLRVAAENMRKAAEIIRIENEQLRQGSETARGNAEQTRNTAEAARVLAEEARAASAAAQAVAEQTRVLDENSRKSAEQTRQSNEASRVSAESARSSAEEARAAAATATASAEALRVAAENARVAAETLRAAAESTRQSTFETNEAARASAYTAAETNRNSAYTAAENARDAAFAAKEVTRDAANEAALNCAETLNALGPKVSKIGDDGLLFEPSEGASTGGSIIPNSVPIAFMSYQVTNGGTFNRAILPVLGGTYTIRCFVSNSAFIAGSYSQRYEPYLVWSKSYTDLPTDSGGKSVTIDIDTPISVSAGQYVGFMFATGDESKVSIVWVAQSSSSIMRAWGYSNATDGVSSANINYWGSIFAPMFTLQQVSVISKRIGELDNRFVLQSNVVDNLNTDSQNPLSAKQGMVLDGKIQVLNDETHKVVLFEPTEGDAPQDATRAIASINVVGSQYKVETSGKFNRVTLPFGGGDLHIQCFVRNSRFAGGQYTEELYPYIVFDKNLGVIEADNGGHSITFTLDSPVSVSANQYVIFLVKSNTTTPPTIYVFESQNSGSTRTGALFADGFEGRVGLWSVNLSPMFTLVQSSALIDSIDGLEAAKENFEERISALESVDSADNIMLPSVLYAVVDTQFNLYFNAFVKGQYRVVAVCPIGKSYEDYYQLTPTVADVGTKSLKIQIYSMNGELSATKTVSLIVISADALSSAKNICQIGDSTLDAANGVPVTRTLSEDFASLGGTTPTFRGHHTDGTYRNCGMNGRTFSTFATQGAYTYHKFMVSGVSSVGVSTSYTHNGSTYSVVESNITNGVGYINTHRTSGSSDPTASGTLTKSSGSGDSTIEFSSWSTEASNPLWNDSTSELDVANYRQTKCGMSANEYFDLVTIRLGVNDVFGSQTTQGIIAHSKTLVDALLADNANCKIVIELPTSCAETHDGFATSYGASNNAEAFENGIWDLRKALIETYDNGAYNANVSVCATCAGVHRKYGFQYVNKQVATRINVTESICGNGVHPSTAGYYQIADFEFPHCLALLR